MNLAGLRNGPKMFLTWQRIQNSEQGETALDGLQVRSVLGIRNRNLYKVAQIEGVSSRNNSRGTLR